MMKSEPNENRGISQAIIVVGVLIVCAIVFRPTAKLNYVDNNITIEVNQSSTNVTNIYQNESYWGKSGDNIYYNDGFVGIGTDTPTYDLEVFGDILLTATDNIIGFNRELENISSPYSGVLELQARTSVVFNCDADDDASDPTDVFKIKIANTTRMIIEKEGHVGIGTTSPTDDLEVSGDIMLTATGDYIKFNHAGESITSAISGTLDFTSRQSTRMDADSDGNQFHASDTYDFKVAGSSAMVIERSGEVGINTTSPIATLDVGGTVRADAYIEYSTIYRGDALSDIRDISSSGVCLSSICDVDHNTLPSYVQQRINYFNNETNMTESFTGRNMGNNVQFNMRAIIQLLDRIEELETELCNENPRRSFCD